MGIPKYIASGSHYFSDRRYRFLVMPRFKSDLHSITKLGRLHPKHFLIVCSQIIDVLKLLHEKHYVHSDLKAENIMIGLCGDKSLQYGSNFLKNQQQQSPSVLFSGTNPVRSCRSANKSNQNIYDDMLRSHYLRPGKSVVYSPNEPENTHHGDGNDSSKQGSDDDDDFELTPKKKKTRQTLKRLNTKKKENKLKSTRSNMNVPSKHHQTLNEKTEDDNIETDVDENDRVFVIDYGLATKFIDTNGEHRPFCMDQRRAHDGTLEFTSRDAHFGAHSRRSDLECLGYNLIYWSQGFLPWKDEKLQNQPEIVHRLKELFMTDVKEMLKLFYGKDVPKYLGEYMQYVGTLEFDAEPDYKYLKVIILLFNF